MKNLKRKLLKGDGMFFKKIILKYKYFKIKKKLEKKRGFIY